MAEGRGLVADLLLGRHALAQQGLQPLADLTLAAGKPLRGLGVLGGSGVELGVSAVGRAWAGSIGVSGRFFARRSSASAAACAFSAARAGLRPAIAPAAWAWAVRASLRTFSASRRGWEFTGWGSASARAASATAFWSVRQRREIVRSATASRVLSSFGA